MPVCVPSQASPEVHVLTPDPVRPAFKTAEQPVAATHPKVCFVTHKQQRRPGMCKYEKRLLSVE